jgi:hypothetical protein
VTTTLEAPPHQVAEMNFSDPICKTGPHSTLQDTGGQSQGSRRAGSVPKSHPHMVTKNKEQQMAPCIRVPSRRSLGAPGAWDLTL